MPARRSPLLALMVSLLLAGSIHAAPRRADVDVQAYLPQIYMSEACAATPVPAVELPLLVRRLAFITDAFLEPKNLALFDPATNRVVLLTEGGNVFGLAWSPDATRIAFTVYDPASETGAIKLLRIADRQLTTLRTWEDKSISGLSWSPDGRRIAFGLSDATSSRIMVMQANGTQLLQLSAIDSASMPAWSPDGRRIAFLSYNYAEGRGTLYLMQADGQHPTPITDGLSYDATIAWSPDGRRLAFNGVCTEGQRLGRQGIFIIRADGTERTILTADLGPGPAIMSSWSPDGQQIAFTQLAPKSSSPVVINASRSGYHVLPVLGRNPVWAPR